MDPYKVLGVSKNATSDEIKSAYKRLTLKYHPDRHLNKSEVEREKMSKMFQEVKLSYDILSNPEKRSNYDKYGNADGPMGGPGGMGGFNFGGFDFSSMGGSRSNFHFSSTMGDDIFDTFFNFAGGPGRRTKSKEPPVVEIPLKCTLEELFTGCTKKLKIKRKLIRHGITESIIEVQIKPGYKKGTKFTFSGQGDQLPDGSFQDIKIILEEKEDLNFVRNGNDLEMKLDIPFKDLLRGFTRQIYLPGKRIYQLTEKDITKIGGWNIIPGRGMPFSKDPSKIGDLKIMITTDMPFLTQTQKNKLINIL
ncbi:DnaJ like protein subfamily B member 13 [Astathelohania contejeani]|uniref:DnaJ like protein subfamily B member 13 n=1 Tax=Astathelohania contejeani TaxID=164912 RepID=A0ABQ7HYH6_9MICR|nr:DnaJ like protein subfamily B member 13 [Thelohania contejeani]